MSYKYCPSEGIFQTKPKVETVRQTFVTPPETCMDKPFFEGFFEHLISYTENMLTEEWKMLSLLCLRQWFQSLRHELQGVKKSHGWNSLTILFFLAVVRPARIAQKCLISYGDCWTIFTFLQFQVFQILKQNHARKNVEKHGQEIRCSFLQVALGVDRANDFSRHIAMVTYPCGNFRFSTGDVTFGKMPI